MYVANNTALVYQTLIFGSDILLSGTGYHVYDLPKKSVQEKVVANYWNFSVQMLYHPLMGSIRASIIMFLFRMKDNRRRIRYALHVVFWLNILYAVSTSLGNILQCNPVRYTWDKPAMDTVDAAGNISLGGTCIDSRTFILTSCALSIFMDLIIIPIPTVMVWNLQMEFKTKMLVVIVMSLGWMYVSPLSNQSPHHTDASPQRNRRIRRPLHRLLLPLRAHQPRPHLGHRHRHLHRRARRAHHVCLRARHKVSLPLPVPVLCAQPHSRVLRRARDSRAHAAHEQVRLTQVAHAGKFPFRFRCLEWRESSGHGCGGDGTRGGAWRCEGERVCVE
jgi:hypothetical protein